MSYKTLVLKRSNRHHREKVSPLKVCRVTQSLAAETFITAVAGHGCGGQRATLWCAFSPSTFTWNQPQAVKLFLPAEPSHTWVSTVPIARLSLKHPTMLRHHLCRLWLMPESLTHKSEMAPMTQAIAYSQNWGKALRTQGLGTGLGTAMRLHNRFLQST